MSLKCSTLSKEQTGSLWGWPGLVAVLAFAVTGCGGPYTGEVSGTVIFNGVPLPGGIVTVVHPDGRIGQAQIRDDGTYSIPQAPGGDVRVTVKTVRPIPGMPASILPRGFGGGKSETVYPAGKYVPIPVRYGEPDKSGLDLKVKRGSQSFDINLAP
jgi:hypothetical protein